MKRRDMLIIAIVLALALSLFAFSRMSLGGAMSSVVVTIGGREVLRKPLAVEDTYEIRQEDGSVNVIAVENGAVYMKEANCRDGLCMAQGRMRNGAKTIVCLPHQLVVRLDGESAGPGDDGLDVII